MEINKSIFQEYSIRGRVNRKELNEESMELIGKGFGTYLARRGIKDVVVGHDSRSYSEKLKDALIEGIVSTGAHVLDMGIILIPMLYYAQHHFRVKGGAMVTAGCDPDGWSGIKLTHSFSKSLAEDEIQEIYRIIKKGNFRTGYGLIKKDHFGSHIKDVYTESATRRVKIKKPLKIVVECGNGTAGFFAPDILRKTSCEIIEETKKVKQTLSEKVKEAKADLGISYCGDGDKLSIVDEKGNNVQSDKLFSVFSTDSADNRFSFNDAIFASLKLIEFLSEQDKPLSEILKTTS